VVKVPSGEMNGVGYELGKELARRMGIPYEPVIYQTPKLLIEDVKSAKWDISFIAQDPDREKILDFTSVYLSLEHGYLVPSGSPIQMMSDLDKALDAFAANKANLFAIADKLPGSHVLEGRFSVHRFALGVPKGREAGLAYARKFIEDAKAEGLVKAAANRAGVRGSAQE